MAAAHNMLKAMIKMGATAEVITKQRAKIAQMEDEAAPHADNLESWAVFMNSQSQWRWVTQTISGGGGASVTVPMRVGFDMTGVESVVRMMGITPTPQLLQDLQLMEGEVLKWENKKK